MSGESEPGLRGDSAAVTISAGVGGNPTERKILLGAIDALASSLAAQRVRTDAAGGERLKTALHAAYGIDTVPMPRSTI